ncbi:hypothetical protein HS048_35445 [Planomonospora sp. ID91781]|uniref:hypothetical protein n=1 Tax=Planomonospora sp. ID91781 TaxID=2738135 RepID=UPI0018C3B490|nr:hypothetical protein [Planomonospora sp. ID91781]MBG0825968.1 hypothetical protein [Planomonospora sp. ID91781]
MRDQYCEEATPVFSHVLLHAHDCLEKARNEAAALEAELDRIRREITELETTMHVLKSWENTATFHPPSLQVAHADTDTDPASPGRKATESPPPARRGRPASPRMANVMNLLAQDPRRWWKNREIADAIGEDPRLLRMTLSYMVDDGRLVKNADACYRYGRETLPQPASPETAAAM